jgi:hypothetical protein
VTFSRSIQTVAAAAAIAALLSLLFVIHLPSDKAWLRVCLDGSHGPIFAVIAIIIAVWLRARADARGVAAAWPAWGIFVRSLLATVVIGIAVEFVQGQQGRPPSAFDVMTDTAGAAAGLALWLLWTRPRPEGGATGDRDVRWTLLAIVLAGVTFVAWRPMQAAAAYAQRVAQFPELAQFEHPRDLYFVTPDGTATGLAELPAPWSQRAGERALRLAFDATHPAAVQLVEPSRDWRGYSVVAADLTNPGDTEIRLVFRILDATHDWTHADRFNLPLVLPPRTRITVRVALDAVESAPASRRMDMARIANVMLFGRDNPAAGELYVSRLWLE